jgi:AcrR family transcriptional regulator
MDRRARKKAEKRRRILDAARTLFEEHGWQRTTIRAVAERADVATGTVLHYFDSKVGLLGATFVQELQDIIEARWASLPDAPLLDQLLYLFEGFWRRYAESPELARVYVRESLFLPEPHQSAYDAVSQGFLAQLVQVVQARAGELRDDVDPGTVAMVCFSMYLTATAMLLRAEQPVVEPALVGLRATLEAVLRPLRR